MKEGIWENGNFLYAKRLTPTVAQTETQRDHLSEVFKRRSQNEREEIQRRLAELGFYRSTIDGLFGKGTSSGIHAYASSQNLPDITTPEGARSVIEKLVTLSPSSTGSQDSALPGSDCPSDTSVVWNNCFGTYTYADGDKYVGEWRDNNQHGTGIFTTASGDRYVGNFVAGYRDGQGTATFADGSTYVGQWKGGKKSGQGTLTLADGTVTTGDFLSGRYIGDGYPFKIKGIALGDTTAPCSPTEYTYSDILGTPVRTAMECYSGTSTDEINVVFSLDDGSVVRVIRKQYLSQSDPDPSDILEAAIGFYGPPTTRDEGNWLALYDNSHSLEYYGQAVSASRNDHGIGLLINGFICADGSSGTKDCGGLGVYVIEYDLVDNQMFNKQVEVGKSLMEEAQKEKISNQEF